MNKKRLLLILLVALVFLSGCSLFNKSTTDPLANAGNLRVSVKIPTELIPVKSKGALDGITLSNVEFIITNGTKSFTKEIAVTGETIEAVFGNISAGIWDITVIAKQIDCEQTYEVFKGNSDSRVIKDKTTIVAVDLNLVPGSISLNIIVPADYVEVENLKVNVSNVVTAESYVETYTKAQLEAPIVLHDLLPTSWNVEIEALNSQGTVIAQGSKLFDIKPGRMSNSIVTLDVGGITIETIWNMPPTKPRNVTVEATPTQVKIMWDAVHGNLKGYLVGISRTADGDIQLITDGLITSTEYVDTVQRYEDEYCYWVAAYNNEGLYSGWAGPIHVKKKNGLYLTIVGKGKVTKTPEDNGLGYAYDTLVTLEAVPDEGHKFIGWRGDATGTDSITLDMSSNRNVTAIFEAIVPLRVPEEYPSIQAAIDAAKEGDTIVVSPGTYYENIKLNSKSNITLTSTNPLDPVVVESTVIDGNQSGACIVVENGERDITISGFTITGGSGRLRDGYTYGGAIYAITSTVTITNSTISDNTAYDGGGVYAAFSSTVVTITDSTISGNKTDTNGGGVYADSASIVTITDSTISGNKTGWQGGGGGVYATFTSTVTITNSTISGNTARYGSGVNANDSSTVTITNSTISGNTAGYGGGGVYAARSPVTITNSTISDNTAYDYGGGVYAAFSPTVIITNSTISGNTAGYGGGAYTSSNNPIIQNNFIKDNNATISGGGIYKSSSSTLLNLNWKTLTTLAAVEAINEFSNNTPDNVFFE